MNDYRNLFYSALDIYESNPDNAIRMISQAVSMAEEVNDRVGVLYMNHWKLQIMIFEKGDYKRAYDLAISTALEGRKPAYAHMTEHVCVQQDLIFCYLGTDPVGNSQMIQDAIQYMDTQITDPMPCRLCWYELKVKFYLTVGDIESASTTAQQYLQAGEHGMNRTHHGAIACSTLSWVSFRQEKWDDLLSYGKQGEEWGKNNRNIVSHYCVLLAAQALALIRLNRENEAISAYNKTLMRVERASCDMLPIYYDMLCAFNRHKGDLEKALTIRQTQLDEIEGKGQNYWESLCRLDRVRLLKQLGKPYEGEAEMARTVIKTLKLPDTLLGQLTQITASNS